MNVYWIQGKEKKNWWRAYCPMACLPRNKYRLLAWWHWKLGHVPRGVAIVAGFRRDTDGVLRQSTKARHFKNQRRRRSGETSDVGRVMNPGRATLSLNGAHTPATFGDKIECPCGAELTISQINLVDALNAAD